MSYVINDDDKYKINPFLFEEGKNAYFARINMDGQEYLLKFFNAIEEELEEKIKTIRYLRKIEK